MQETRSIDRDDGARGTPAPPPPTGSPAAAPGHESWFRSLVEQTIAGTYVIRDGHFLYVNPKLAELFGYSVEEVLAQCTVGDLVAPEDRETVLENVRRRLAGEVRSIHYTFRGLRRDGSRFDVEAHGSRAEMQGAPVVIGLLLDVTERTCAERERAALLERTRQALRSRDEVLAVVSHDLRNPLNAIVMTTDLMLMQDGEGQAADMLRRIKRLTGRMEVLIRDLLDVSAVEAGRMSVQREPEPVRSIVAAAEEMLRPQAEERGIRMEVAVEDCIVEADYDRVVQVISNLGGNALKFTSGGGTVRLSARCEGGAVHFLVEDTGCGIPEEQQRYLFEPFWQGNGGDGAGLGLAIARGIVRAHGGDIQVDSEPGRGTRMGFTLERHHAAATA